MAFSTIIRRSSSSISPISSRIISRHRHYHTVAATAFSILKQRSYFSRQFRPAAYFSGRFFSSESQSSDDKLLKTIDYEIKCAEETEDGDQVRKFPPYYENVFHFGGYMFAYFDYLVYILKMMK